MLKSIYGFLFTDQDQAKRPIPTINQIFSGIDVNTTPVQSQLVYEEPIKQTLVIDTPQETAITNLVENQLTVNSLENIQDFNSKITEHIVAQKQIYEERLRQEEIDKIEKPKRNIPRWIPNDKLVAQHDLAAEAVSKVPNLLKKIKQHQDKIASKQADVDKINNKKDLNPYDRFELLDYLQDIIKEEDKISEIELQLIHAQSYIDNPIFEEFALYLVKANNYIKEAELTGIMSTGEILTSQAIYVKTKSMMDQLKYGKKNPILMNKLQFISQIFNMGDVHENSRGKNLREFGDFFIKDNTDNPLYLFDQMDIKAIGDSSKLRSIIGDTACEMIDNDLVNVIDLEKLNGDRI